MFENKSSSFLIFLPAAFVALTLAGCGGSKQPTADEAAAPIAADVTVVAKEAEAEAAAQAQAAREAELARLESEMTLKEREADLARREAELAAQQKSAQRQVAAPRPAATAAAPAPVEKTQAPAAVARTYVVPAGTQLTVEIVSPLTTKTARVGDSIDARLASDIVVDGKTVAFAGSAMRGTVTEVVSGSQKIGGIPTLGLTFNRLTLGGADTVAISGRLVEQGKSDTARDTAKIAGGALAGAIVGHQIDGSKGRIIGGLLGGAAGAVAAKKTGTEVELASGTVVGFMLDDSFEVITK